VPEHCYGCNKDWASPAWCHCSGCHELFGSLSAFDRHRKRFACIPVADFAKPVGAAGKPLLVMHPKGCWVTSLDDRDHDGSAEVATWSAEDAPGPNLGSGESADAILDGLTRGAGQP